MSALNRVEATEPSPQNRCHRIYRVESFEIVAPYTLLVKFDDKTQQAIDFQPVLAGELFRPLRDPELFNRVELYPEVHTLTWPNGADFDPETLHDWTEHADVMEKQARDWESVTA